MATATIRETVKRLKSAWTEMDYAQRRLFEIRTGLPVTGPEKRTGPATSVEELEALYAREEQDLAA